MKGNKIYLIILLPFLFNISILAQKYVAPQMEFVCELKVTVDPVMTLGPTAHGKYTSAPLRNLKRQMIANMTG